MVKLSAHSTTTRLKITCKSKLNTQLANYVQHLISLMSNVFTLVGFSPCSGAATSHLSHNPTWIRHTTAAADVDFVFARAPRGAFLSSSLGSYHPTWALASLMWFGRTWRGLAVPKVISRAVTSETHFPTIKEREKLSWPNFTRFHGTESDTCMRVWTVPPYHNCSQTHIHTHCSSTLYGDRAFQNVFTSKGHYLPP